MIRQQDIIARFTFQDLILTMFWDGATRGSKSRIYYTFTKAGKVLMEGDDFCTPSYPDSTQAVCQLLGFITVQPGDTDKEYFAEHAPEMMSWLNTTQCDELNILVSDFEMNEEGAVEAFEKATEINPGI